jgi:hypothetical protein
MTVGEIEETYSRIRGEAIPEVLRVASEKVDRSNVAP